MEIKAETFKDKLYSHIAKHITVYAFVILGIWGVTWGISTDANNMEKRKALEIKKVQLFKAKVAFVIKNKPFLVCGHKAKLYLTSDQYDIITIDNINYVVTQETRATPLESLTMKSCSIIEIKTDTMTITVPKIIPIDDQHAIEITKLNKRLLEQSQTIASYVSQKTKYKNALRKAINKINSLTTIVKDQDAELNKMMVIEAQYNEVKALLTIVLNKKNINIKDLVVTEVKPKSSSIKVKKILKNINKDTLVVKTEIIPLENIADSKEYIKRQMYTIREIPQMHKQKEDSETLNHIMRRPSLKELDDITITEAQLKDIEHVKSQLNIAIKGMIKIYATRFDIDGVTFRNNIKLNVGI